MLWLRRWLEKTERETKQTEVVNLLNSLTRFAVSAASAERVLIVRFCTWKPDHLYTLNGFWMKSRKQQYGICISSRILYSRLYIEAIRRKTNTFSLVASFDLEVSPSCVRLSDDPSTKKKKNQHSFWASTRPYIGWRSHVWRACLVHAGRRLVWDLAGRPSGRAS